jgi:hypothetical protein
MTAAASQSVRRRGEIALAARPHRILVLGLRATDANERSPSVPLDNFLATAFRPSDGMNITRRSSYAIGSIKSCAGRAD